MEITWCNGKSKSLLIMSKAGLWYANLFSKSKSFTIYKKCSHFKGHCRKQIYLASNFKNIKWMLGCYTHITLAIPFKYKVICTVFERNFTYPMRSFTLHLLSHYGIKDQLCMILTHWGRKSFRFVTKNRKTSRIILNF